jgi:hypothetical protein
MVAIADKPIDLAEVILVLLDTLRHFVQHALAGSVLKGIPHKLLLISA